MEKPGTMMVPGFLFFGGKTIDKGGEGKYTKDNK